MTLPDIDVWDELLIQLAKILDDARWTIETYSLVKTELCDKIIVAIQPLLHYTAYIGKKILFRQFINVDKTVLFFVLV